MVSRVAIVCLLGAALAVSACDKGSGGGGQAAGGNAATTAASADEVPASGAARPDKVDRSHKGEAAPDASFTTLAGAPTTLGSLGGGRPLLVNLWATWCAPCVKEMPTLDAAAGTLAGKIRVVAVSQDMEPAKAKDFLKARGFARLEPFLDEKLALSTAYGANLPTTILYDAAGKEIWRVTGDLDWTGAQARALLAEAG